MLSDLHLPPSHRPPLLPPPAPRLPCSPRLLLPPPCSFSPQPLLLPLTLVVLPPRSLLCRRRPHPSPPSANPTATLPPQPPPRNVILGTSCFLSAASPPSPFAFLFPFPLPSSDPAQPCLLRKRRLFLSPSFRRATQHMPCRRPHLDLMPSPPPPAAALAPSPPPPPPSLILPSSFRLTTMPVPLLLSPPPPLLPCVLLLLPSSSSPPPSPPFPLPSPPFCLPPLLLLS